MNIEERHKELLLEAQALRFYYKVDDMELYQAFSAFAKAWNSPEHVEHDEFIELINAIDARLEDICIERKITQEFLEVLIEGNEEDLKHIRIC